jgi:hypothetical protein
MRRAGDRQRQGRRELAAALPAEGRRPLPGQYLRGLPEARRREGRMRRAGERQRQGRRELAAALPAAGRRRRPGQYLLGLPEARRREGRLDRAGERPGQVARPRPWEAERRTDRLPHARKRRSRAPGRPGEWRPSCQAQADLPLRRREAPRRRLVPENRKGARRHRPPDRGQAETAGRPARRAKPDQGRHRLRGPKPQTLEACKAGAARKSPKKTTSGQAAAAGCPGKPLRVRARPPRRNRARRKLPRLSRRPETGRPTRPRL